VRYPPSTESVAAPPPCPELLELSAQVLGVPVTVSVLEPGDCDPHAVYAAIRDGHYEKPFVVDDGETRQLLFSLDFIQSAMRLADPAALEFAYTRKMMACLLFVPEPEHLLMVGLGGGSLAKFCYRHLPHTRITVLEINPDVIALRHVFEIPDDPRLSIIQTDAAAYLPGAPAAADVLLLDGYDPAGISPSFLHREFYRAARACLRPGGMLVANLAGPESAWAAHRTLLEFEFEQVQLLATADADNHVAFAHPRAVEPRNRS
jgi:spermidine synthase